MLEGLPTINALGPEACDRLIAIFNETNADLIEEMLEDEILPELKSKPTPTTAHEWTMLGVDLENAVENLWDLYIQGSVEFTLEEGEEAGELEGNEELEEEIYELYQRGIKRQVTLAGFDARIFGWMDR